jgi:hypothetical protein
MEYVILEKSRVKGFTRTRRGKMERVSPFERRGERTNEKYEKFQYYSQTEGPEVIAWVVEGKKNGKWHDLVEFGPNEERLAEKEQERLEREQEKTR